MESPNFFQMFRQTWNLWGCHIAAALQASTLLGKHVLYAAQRAKQVGSLVRQIDGLAALTTSHFLQGLDLLHGQQVVDRFGATVRNGIGDVADGSSFSLGLQHLGTCLTFSLQNVGLLLSFSGIDFSLLLTF